MRKVTIPLLLLVSNLVIAQTQWQFINTLYGGDIKTIFFFREDIYIGTDGDGMYKYNRSDRHWDKINNFPSNSKVYSIASNSIGHIFASTLYNTYKSTNEGLTWTEFQISNDMITSFIRDTTNNIIYAGGSGRIYKSLDNGDNWKVDTLTTLSDRISCIETDHNSSVYAGTWGGQMFVSSNNGVDWLNVVISSQSGSIRALKYNNHSIYAATSPMSNRGDLYRSHDGKLWAKVYSLYVIDNYIPRDLYISSIETDNMGNIYITANRYANILKSTNNGQSFLELVDFPAQGLNFIRYSAGENTLYAGTNGTGIFISSDYGSNWEEFSQGITLRKVDKIKVDNKWNIFVGSNLSNWSIYTSNNYGSDWEKTSLNYVRGELKGLDIDTSGNIFSAIDNKLFRYNFLNKIWEEIIKTDEIAYFNCDKYGGIYLIGYSSIIKSTDGGDIFHSLVYPHSPYNIRKIISDSEGYLYAYDNNVILRSISNGLSWKNIFSIDNSTVSNIDIDSKNNIYVGFEQEGLFLGSNYGRNWVKILDDNIYDIVVDHSDNIYIVTFRKILKSTDGGFSWVNTTGNLNFYSGVSALATTERGNLFVSIGHKGTYRSTDFSYPVNIKSFDGYNVNKDVFIYWETTEDCNNLGFEVMRSEDKTNWNTRTFLEGNSRSDSCISQQYNFNDVVLNYGTYFYRLKQISTDSLISYSDILELNVLVPRYFRLLQNHPNPFNSTTSIEFALPIAADVELMVYNILGQQVASLIDEQRSAGNHSILWNADDSKGMKLSSGIYLYKVKATGNDGSEFQETKKMVLLK